MPRVECEFEPEVLAAVVQSRWPERCDPELRAHAQTCAICSDVAAIAGAIGRANDELRPAAVVPDAGKVWFLSQLRARREAVRNAERPITVTQLFAVAGATGVLGACLGATSTEFRETLHSLGSAFAGLDFLTLIGEHSLLAAAVAAVIFLLPAAAWLAIRRE
jgi:hypothetical protein